MTTTSIKFGFNHMVAPSLTPDELVTAAVKLGAVAIELRNDIGANSLNDIETARRVGAKARDAGLEVRSVNALYPFNMWSDDLARRTELLAAIAAASGATGLVMCPLNENKFVEDTPRKGCGVADGARRPSAPFSEPMASRDLSNLWVSPSLHCA